MRFFQNYAWLLPVSLVLVIFSGCGKQETPAPATAPANQPAAVAPTFINEPAIQGAMAELKAKTDQQEKDWNVSKNGFNADLEHGAIHFQGPDSTILSAPLQIIGTYNTTDGIFTWAWDMPSLAPTLMLSALNVRHYGQQHGIREFLEPKLKADMNQAWGLTAAAFKVNNAEGAYARPASQSVVVFMIFGKVVSTTQPSSQPTSQPDGSTTLPATQPATTQP